MEEISPFAGNPLECMAGRRQDPSWVASLLEEPQTRILPLFGLKPLLRQGPPLGLDWQSVLAWRPLIAAGASLIFLGIGEGRAHFAIDAGAADAPKDLAEVRELAPLLSAAEAAILGEARALIDWHARHGFCAACGARSHPAAAGWKRRCPDCGADHFPRVDPVVIMLAVRRERCLLGRNRRRPGRRFSCLAGFMEPGESLEEAVRREVFEEAAIRVGRVRYLASQPWPFPSNLMLGCLAEAISEEIAVDPEELAEARWFEREEVRTMVSRAAEDPAGDAADPERPSLPGPIAIAHQICRRWAFGGEAI
jgi:NAD+ diphosphatase